MGRTRPKSVVTFISRRCFVERAIDESAHAAVLREVSVDELLGLFGIDADLLRQSECRQSVHDAEVHCLGASAMLGVEVASRDAEDLRRRKRVNVFSSSIGLDQQLVFGEVCQQT